MSLLSNLSKVEDLTFRRDQHESVRFIILIGTTYVFLTLLLVFKILIKRGGIALVACETGEGSKFLAILGIFNSTKLEDRTIDVLNLLKFLRIFLFDLGQKLKKVLKNNALELPEEAIGLKSFTRNVERKVISYIKEQVRRRSLGMYKQLYRQQQPWPRLPT